MTATEAASLDLSELTAVFGRLVKAFRSVAAAVRRAFDAITRQMRPLVKAWRRHGRGYSSPAPLSIDGHAYTLRLRARTKAGRWRQ